MEFTHQPVLLNETIKYLNINAKGIYLDGTFGRGGHSQGILENLLPGSKLIAIDRDLTAVKVGKKIFADNPIIDIHHANYKDLGVVLKNVGIEKVDGMLFDLGVSSPQLDNPERGFSYQKDGPLDMRMNQTQSLTASDIVNHYGEEEIKNIISDYGEENWSVRIAEFIVKMREKKPLQTTGDLVEVIKAAIPASARRGGGHPARRTFQALRIATNDELNQLKEMIKNAIKYLKVGGRICIISFQSLEDRIVKHTFRELAKNCECPPDFPICVCDKEKEVKVVTRKPVTATEKEITDNPRSRSALLRVAEKL